MNDQAIISKINEYLHYATRELCAFLKRILPRVTYDWWQECVLESLSYQQKTWVDENGITELEQLDLAALLRITDKSWNEMRSVVYLRSSERQTIKKMIRVRNNWAHCAGSLPEKDAVVDNISTIQEFFENVIVTNVYTTGLEEFKAAVEETDFSTLENDTEQVVEAVVSQENVSTGSDGEIKERDTVFLTGSPDTKGMVFSVKEINGVKKYEVFVDGGLRTFYDGQIKPLAPPPAFQWVNVESFRTEITAYEINNPSAGNLYSLNAARIDFVPYQFRPALKLIKSDEPRILIADSVGIGKTIEAGLIIKELEARHELESILIICPKPLIAERKWELEMQRFDEDFVPMDGASLKQAISDTHRDEEWPVRYNKAIIPYSILDSKILLGDETKKGKVYGLKQLDPSPHFDLVIIDEAHHIRNGSLDKDKAFAYKCVHYFCEHADAVVMLTATPLQTSDDDLFTLMNLLRPDVIIDKEIFSIMARPNEYIYRCSHAIRNAGENWQNIATEALLNITHTQWGENVISKNPLYTDILCRLAQDDVSRDERVKLISDVESLHSFNAMLNRTRRKDIQDFCIRRPFTVETSFTPEQYALHNELLQFEYMALSQLHDARSIPFMMSTIRRQAASCIFGLAPFIRSLIDRRINVIYDDPDFDIDQIDINDKDASILMKSAKRVLELADQLSEEDPKFDSIVNIIEEKQQQENNKIILFSSFRHTLGYLKKKLLQMEYRVAQIDGDVKDEERRALRERFELIKDDPQALDILLFTEVGSEGLDYQFCDTMINYDLPWNPMRIEQRIGRIDRRGQQSEAVNIYNIITADTVDADIYNRCLMRIGVFERSIGECEEVLGAIGNQIEQIALNTELTDDERRMKLEQMADNEIRRLQELTNLEDEERTLFGFDLSNYTMSKDIKGAESPWVTPPSIQSLVERYLNERLGEGQYILGRDDLKTIRLSKDVRTTLLFDSRSIPDSRSMLKRKWENYLKGDNPLHPITFVPETASKERRAFFFTSMHPLVKQAARYFKSSDIIHIHLEYYSDVIPEGTYPFSVYAWRYTGLQPMFKVVPICDNDLLREELVDILQEADSIDESSLTNSNLWDELEGKHIALWNQEKDQYLSEMKVTADYRVESIRSNYRNKRRSLEQKLSGEIDDNRRRMFVSELQTAEEKYQRKVADINDVLSRADIHTALIANGIIDIRRE